jgi:hypothetical protein
MNSLDDFFRPNCLAKPGSQSFSLIIMQLGFIFFAISIVLSLQLSATTIISHSISIDLSALAIVFSALWAGIIIVRL